MNTIRLALVIGLAAVAAARPSSASDGTATTEANPRVRWAEEPVSLPDFKLTDDRGRAFGTADLHGQTALLFFGFTHCRNVCPVTLQQLRQVQRSLGTDSGKVVNVFISVDGARDTPTAMHAYLEPFSPGFIGLTGEPAAVRVLADKLSAVFFMGNPTDAQGGYDVEHTSQVYLLDAKGRLRATFYAAGADAMTAATKTVLHEAS